MYSYLIILLASVFIPVLFSFEKRVFYISKWPKVLKSAAIVAVPFLIWDSIFTDLGIWGFNESYTLGTTAFGLPIEEILFFLAIPFSIFIFWEISLHYKFYKLIFNYNYFYNFVILIPSLFLIYFWGFDYTMLVMIVSIFTTFVIKKQNKTVQKNVILLFLISIPFFLIVNGLLTSLPIVWYDTAQKSNIMLGSIPIEDLFYSYSLLSLNAVIYSKIR